MNLNELAFEAHSHSFKQGFYKDGEHRAGGIVAQIMLIVTELSEAVEAIRSEDWENFREEIADTFIRLGDLCGHLSIDIDTEVQNKMDINKCREFRHGKNF